MGMEWEKNPLGLNPRRLRERPPVAIEAAAAAAVTER